MKQTTQILVATNGRWISHKPSWRAETTPESGQKVNFYFYLTHIHFQILNLCHKAMLPWNCISTYVYRNKTEKITTCCKSKTCWRPLKHNCLLRNFSCCCYKYYCYNKWAPSMKSNNYWICYKKSIKKNNNYFMHTLLELSSSTAALQMLSTTASTEEEDGICRR